MRPNYIQVSLSLIKCAQCHEDVWENGVIVPCSVNLALDTDEWADTLSGHFAACAFGIGLNL